MSDIASVLLAVLAVIVLVPMAVLFVECVGALLPAPRELHAPAARRPRLAVLVPAHDEESVIGPTLDGLTRQLGSGDRIVVIADNCTDATARLARERGATVTERCEPERRGKGFALRHGVRFLEADPPEVVAIVDADCRIEPGGLDALARAVASTGRPVQGLYLLEPRPGAGPAAALSALAFALKNHVRPRGLRRLGLPCLLTGSGMAFPWPVLAAADAPVTAASIVEDLELGLDLALAGHPPRFLAAARATSPPAERRESAAVQRRRWGQGHIRTAIRRVPELLGAGLRRRRLDLVALALELAVPPVSLLSVAWATVTAAAFAGVGLGASSVPALGLAASGALLAATLGVVAIRFRPPGVPARSILLAPLHVFASVPLYVRGLLGSEPAWARTPREPVDPR